MAIWQRSKSPDAAEPSSGEDAAAATEDHEPPPDPSPGTPAEIEPVAATKRRRPLRRTSRPAPDPDLSEASEPSEQPELPKASAAPDTLPEPAEPAPTPEATENQETAAEERRPRARLSIAESSPVTLFLAAHPKQGIATALGVAGAALASGREEREVVVTGLTVLVGHTILGWHNDLVDRTRDARLRTPRKPIAQGRLDPGTAWFALTVAVLVLVPLSISTGITAGAWLLGSVAVGVVGNVALRRGRFSFLTWAASYALLVPYLSYGGWGGDAEVAAPQPAMVALAALLGIGVHLVRSIWGLVADDADDWQTVPLRLGRRIGASRLLLLGGVYLVAVLAAITAVGLTVGLRQ